MAEPKTVSSTAVRAFKSCSSKMSESVRGGCPMRLTKDDKTDVLLTIAFMISAFFVWWILMR